MPRATPQYNLHVIRPDLVREWHPTKNKNLKPADVTPGSGKKVWWICREGHEWKAAIYSRNRGSGCPFCSRTEKSEFGVWVLSRSNLIKEWHPTKNGNLTPAIVTHSYRGKIWWICENGHEWETTVKSRLNGGKCPACAKESFRRVQKISNRTPRKKIVVNRDNFIEKMSEDFQTDPYDTYKGAEFRKNRRYRHEATAIFEILTTGSFMYARAHNFSETGMYFETEAAIRTGTKIKIKLDRPIFSRVKKSFTSTVKWCRGLTDETASVYAYGLGVEFT